MSEFKIVTKISIIILPILAGADVY